MQCNFVGVQIGKFGIPKKIMFWNSGIETKESKLASYQKKHFEWYPALGAPPRQNQSLSTLRSHSGDHAQPALLKSVPVSWARMRKERDWVVPVRGCQSSVSWISLLLLRSLGIKQGRFSTLRPCLHTHPPAAAAAHGRHESLRNTRAHTHTLSLSDHPAHRGRRRNRGRPRTQRARLDTSNHGPARRELMDGH